MSVKLGDAEVAGFSGGGSIDAIDDTTITKNSDDEIQAVATVNQNTATGATNPVYDWVGTLDEYNAQNIETLHPDWLCYITDDADGGDSVYTKTETDGLLITMLETLYPVGSIYIGTQSACPLSVLISNSTWEIVATNRALWGGDGTNANTTIEAGLPNITGTWRSSQDLLQTGAAYRINSGQSGFGGSKYGSDTGFDASRSSSIYGNSTTVQPPAYRVNIWRRTA